MTVGGLNQQGLSPRVRGNPLDYAPGDCGEGSIPACAGEPSTRRTSSPTWWVYPRVCGGTMEAWRYAASGYGLSRVCGGTRAVIVQLRDGWGLSPRVRGNLTIEDAAMNAGGSIPACAGEPLRGWRRYGPPGVYPRVCGGTCPARRLRPAGTGLSPRVRGNPRRRWSQYPKRGSIPACAGEPLVILADCPTEVHHTGAIDLNNGPNLRGPPMASPPWGTAIG